MVILICIFRYKTHAYQACFPYYPKSQEPIELTIFTFSVHFPLCIGNLRHDSMNTL